MSVQVLCTYGLVFGLRFGSIGAIAFIELGDQIATTTTRIDPITTPRNILLPSIRGMVTVRAD